MPEFFVGRQPIFDRDRKIQAYELLFRGDRENRADIVDGDRATSQVILDGVIELGLDRLVGDKPAFINLTRSFITEAIPLTLPRDRVVLEILEDIEVDDELVEAVRHFATLGYRLALDDFVYQETKEPLLGLIDFIKVDVRLQSMPEIRELVGHLRACHGNRLHLLAEKVETEAEFEQLLDLGFDYFQGYFLSRPNIVSGRRPPANQLSVLELMRRLGEANADVRRIEEVISRDVNLSYRLLRYINSAAYAFDRRVESVQRAIVYLGFNMIRNWVTVMALSGMGDEQGEQVVTSLVRARMCQGLAEQAGLAEPDSYFTVGLFSNLDRLLQMPMPEILEQLPMSEEINRALLESEGLRGEALACAISFETGTRAARRFMDMDNLTLSQRYLDAVVWANDQRKALFDKA